MAQIAVRSFGVPSTHEIAVVAGRVGAEARRPLGDGAAAAVGEELRVALDTNAEALLSTLNVAAGADDNLETGLVEITAQIITEQTDTGPQVTGKATALVVLLRPAGTEGAESGVRQVLQLGSGRGGQVVALQLAGASAPAKPDEDEEPFRGGMYL